jgi:hypothetical protein
VSSSLAAASATPLVSRRIALSLLRARATCARLLAQLSDARAAAAAQLALKDRALHSLRLELMQHEREAAAVRRRVRELEHGASVTRVAQTLEQSVERRTGASAPSTPARSVPTSFGLPSPVSPLDRTE